MIRMSIEKDIAELYREVDGAGSVLPDNDYDPIDRGRLTEVRERWRSQSDVSVTTNTNSAPRPAPLGSWHRIIIPDDDVAIADINARGLMSDYVMAHLAYVVQHGLPIDDGVYHDTHGERGHVYYFSPQASAIGVDVLREYSATTCPEPENLAELRKQKF
jgi:hypothetical protein